jgi:hypothetical protein
METTNEIAAQIAVAPVTPAPVVEVPKEDLISRVSKVKVEVPVINVEEPHFDVNDIEKITDPVAKEQATRAYKSFQRGFNQKFQELSEMRKQLESQKAQQPTQWTPERIKQELNKPDFIQASQTVLQEQNPPNSGMNETEWSSLTATEKKQWQAMQNELTSLKQQQSRDALLQNFRVQDETLKTKYANYNPEAVDMITSELLTGKRQATREDLFRSLDYENAVKRAYELGKQDSKIDKQEKINASSFDGVNSGKPAVDLPVAEKNESAQSYFGKLVFNNIKKMQAQR